MSSQPSVFSGQLKTVWLKAVTADRYLQELIDDLDSKEQRRILGNSATGVTVASTKIGDETWGMTANAVTSVVARSSTRDPRASKEGQRAASLKKAVALR
ncbi:MAG: hypothetical protein H6821_08810 [Planctomycetaceae bacterium]|nr:hypothetical protein [Planctomycetaceae bacterium]